MALHELAANAVLHGALASSGGRAALRWTVDDSGEVVLEWRETGAAAGPAPQAGMTGLGLTMLQTTVRHQLDGEVAFEWLPDGLLCRITIPPRPGATAGWEISPSLAGAVQ
jgi:two-component sensor histidine kinase